LRGVGLLLLRARKLWIVLDVDRAERGARDVVRFALWIPVRQKDLAELDLAGLIQAHDVGELAPAAEHAGLRLDVLRDRGLEPLDSALLRRVQRGRKVA